MRVYIACLQPHGSLLAQTGANAGMKRNSLVSTPESTALEKSTWRLRKKAQKCKKSGVFQNSPTLRQDADL